MNRIADELRHWRHDRWLTQAEAAELLQISLTTYWRWEKGRTVPQYRALQALRARFEEDRRAGALAVAPGGRP